MHETETTYPTRHALCKRIRATRRQLELSQLEVAQHIGISQSQYSLFENGHAKLSAELIERVRNYLNDQRNTRSQLVT